MEVDERWSAGRLRVAVGHRDDRLEPRDVPEIGGKVREEILHRRADVAEDRREAIPGKQVESGVVNGRCAFPIHGIDVLHVGGCHRWISIGSEAGAAKTNWAVARLPVGPGESGQR